MGTWRLVHPVKPSQPAIMQISTDQERNNLCKLRIKKTPSQAMPNKAEQRQDRMSNPE